MFGHEDNTKKDDHTDDLTGPTTVPTVPTDDNQAVDSDSPAFIMSAPADDAKPAPSDHPVAGESNDLIEIKQSALKQLTPLVGHLNQTPEEKFRTTMMMIQAADNQALIKDAYDAAQSISDEKTKAQALLDIINEINYFTQKH